MDTKKKLEIAEALDVLSNAIMDLACLYTDPGIPDRAVVELTKVNRKLLDAGERLKNSING